MVFQGTSTTTVISCRTICNEMNMKRNNMPFNSSINKLYENKISQKSANCNMLKRTVKYEIKHYANKTFKACIINFF